MTDKVRERSTAWQLGWLAVSGPATIIVGATLTFTLQSELLGVLTLILQLWVLAGVVFGVCAVVTGVRDRHRPRRDSLRGAVVGSVGVLLCAAELIAFGSLVASFDQQF